MDINELIDISINGLKENYDIEDVHEVVRAMKIRISNGVITEKVGIEMLQCMSENSTPKIEMKHILKAWEKAPRIRNLKLEARRIQKIKGESEKGLKSQDIYKMQLEELENLNNKLEYHISHHQLTYADKKRIIDNYINNTENLHLSKEEVQKIRNTRKRVGVKLPIN